QCRRRLARAGARGRGDRILRDGVAPRPRLRLGPPQPGHRAARQGPGGRGRRSLPASDPARPQQPGGPAGGLGTPGPQGARGRGGQDLRATNRASREAWLGYVELGLFLGEQDESRRGRRALLDHFGATTDPYVAEPVGRACLLLPGTEDELRQAVALTDRAVA